jgi:inosine-uridine nucleoside N-ribohydrolase
MGKTVGDFLRVTGRPPNVRAVVEFDNQRFIELFLERMEALANANGKR